MSPLHSRCDDLRVIQGEEDTGAVASKARGPGNGDHESESADFCRLQAQRHEEARTVAYHHVVVLDGAVGALLPRVGAVRFEGDIP